MDALMDANSAYWMFGMCCFFLAGISLVTAGVILLRADEQPKATTDGEASVSPNRPSDAVSGFFGVLSLSFFISGLICVLA